MEHESFESQEVADALNAELRLDQGRPRGAARRRPRLHDVRPVDHGFRRLADDRVPHAGAEAVLRRHLLPAAVEVGPAGLHGPAGGDRARLDRTIGRASTSRRRNCSTGSSRSPAPTAGRRPNRPSPVPTRWPKRWSSTRWRSIAEHGGFGESPKFPRPSELLFLLREHARTGAAAAADDGDRDAARDGARRHARSRRRRLPSLFGRRGVAGAALREDALRPGATGARVPGSRRPATARRRRASSSPRSRKTRWPTSRATCAIRPAASIPRRTPTASPRWRRRPRRRGPSTSGATPRSAPSSAPTPASSASASGSSRTATRRTIRRRSSPDRTCSIRRGSIEEVAAETGRHGRRRRRRARPRAADSVRRPRDTAAAASRRQGAHLLERDDDRRLRARGARAAGPAAGGRVAGDGAGRGAQFIRDRLWRAADGTLLRRYRDGDAVDRRPTPKTTRRSSGACSSCSRPTAIPRGWRGRASCRRSRTRASGTRRTAAGSAPPAAIRPCCCGSRRTTTARSPPPARCRSSISSRWRTSLTTRRRERKSERTLGRYGERAGRAARVIPMMLAGLSAWHAGATQIVVVGERRATRALRRGASRATTCRSRSRCPCAPASAAGARGGAAVHRGHAAAATAARPRSCAATSPAASR